MKYICKICGNVLDRNEKDLDSPCQNCGATSDFFDILKEKEREEHVFLDIDEDNLAISRDASKCVSCGNCKSVCKFKQGVYGTYDIQKCKCKTVCVECGQCSIACPSGAISYKKDYEKLEKLLSDPSKVVVFQISPSARVSYAEEFGKTEGTICTGKLISALRLLGAKYVFDTTFGADLTIMEEAYELSERLKSKQNLPLMTSCCPSWVKFVEIFYPDKINLLSTCLSPIAMQGEIISNYFAKKMKINKKNLIIVAITPCTAKKAEAVRTGKYDFAIPVRELADWLKKKDIRFDELPEGEFDDLMGTGSGGGIIFGTSGGVTESALRELEFLQTGKNPKNLNFYDVRSLDGFKECKIKIGRKKLSIAVVSGLNNARKLFENMKNGKKYDFVEVMACLGGCMAGGGQPKNLRHTYEEVRKMRSQSLYALDESSPIRVCHENPQIIKVYENYLKNRGNLCLHTKFSEKSDILG